MISIMCEEKTFPLAPGVNDKPIANIKVHGQELDIFLVKSGQDGCLLYFCNQEKE